MTSGITCMRTRGNLGSVKTVKSERNSQAHGQPNEPGALEERLLERVNQALWATETDIWDWDIERKQLWSSAGRQGLFGEGEEEYTQHFDIEDDQDPWVLRLHPKDRARVLQGIRAQLKNGNPLEVEYRYRLPNGEYKWLRSQGRVVSARDGKPLHVAGSNTDISKQKHAEIEAQRFREAVDNASEGFALYDGDERFVYANKRYREMFPEIASHLVPGARREDIRQTFYSSGALPAAIGRVDEFIDEVRQQQLAGTTAEMQLEKGTWIQRSDHILPHGGIVSIRTDITNVKQREEAFRSNEKRYRSLIEDQPDFVCRFKPDGRMLYSNLAYARQCGFDPSDAGQASIFDFVPHDEHDSLRRHIASLGPDKPFAKIEHRVIVSDGSIQWQEWADRAFFDESGRVVELQSFGRDITDRKTAEEKLRLSEAQLASAQQLSHIGSWTWEPETGALQWSDEHYRIFGIEPVGRDITIEEAAGLAHPDDRELVAQALAKLRDHNTPYDIEYRLLTPSGEARIIHSRGGRFSAGADPDNRIHGTAQDITERKYAENAMRESEARLVEAQEIANVGSWALEIEEEKQARTLWSAELCRIYGIEQNAIPQDFSAHLLFIHVQDRDLVDCAWRHSLHTGMPFESEYRIVRPDGEVRNVLTKARMLQGQKQNSKHWTGATLDITDRVKIEHELFQAKERAEFADRQKSEFLANMSHERRTPLNAIIGFSQIMDSEMYGPVGDSRYTEYVRDIMSSGEHLLSLINDILDLSRIEAGRKELSEQEVDLRLVVTRCAHMLNANANEAGLNLKTEFDDPLPQLWGDRRAVSQITLNLLSNAIKFTKPGGKILATARLEPDGGLAISVRDTGIGIEAEDIPRVLSRFGQVESSYNRKIQGTGLGLQLVDSLVKLHGGEIGLDSKFGVGTTAIVRFPKSRTRPHAVPPI